MIGKSIMRYLARKAILSLVIADDSVYPRAQVKSNGVTRDVMRFSPYGLDSQPPEGALALVLALNGRPDDLLALFSTPTNRYKDLDPGDVKIGNPEAESFVYFRRSGEVIFKVPKGNLTIDLDQGESVITLAGDVNVEITGSLTISATDGFTVEGDTVFDGNLTMTGDLSVDGSTEFTGPVDITGNTSITGTLAVTGAITATTTVTATTNVIGGGKSLLTHTHPDPVSGNTGPPN